MHPSIPASNVSDDRPHGRLTYIVGHPRGGTSWLGDNFDPVLLYGTLVEAYTMMKGETDLLKLYNDKYMEALQQLKRLCDGMERQDAYRSGQVRVPVI